MFSRWLDSFLSLRRPEYRAAWLIALAADTIQIAVFPLFAEGGFSPSDTALDVVVAFLLIRLLGWHWAFLPSFGAELIPGLDLFPSWTAAVYFVTRSEFGASAEPEIIPPGPTPAPRA
ncbi:MAG TPA: hypothetical protein VMU28_03550 [Terriglobales bacterium]|nr:hypothetical protein [Terriglobales bacterium]